MAHGFDKGFWLVFAVSTALVALALFEGRAAPFALGGVIVLLGLFKLDHFARSVRAERALAQGHADAELALRYLQTHGSALEQRLGGIEGRVAQLEAK